MFLGDPFSSIPVKQKNMLELMTYSPERASHVPGDCKRVEE